MQHVAQALNGLLWLGWFEQGGAGAARPDLRGASVPAGAETRSHVFAEQRVLSQTSQLGFK